MTDQVVLQEAENRRAELLDRALADGKGIEAALALAARAEAFITGALAPMAILHAQPALPPPVPRDPRLAGIEIVDESRQPLPAARPLTDAGPESEGPVMTATEILERRQKPAASGKRGWWSAEDTAYLKQAWPSGVFMEEIAARLEGRLEDSIRVKAQILGLKRSPEFRSIVNRMAARKRHDRGAKLDHAVAPAVPEKTPRAPTQTDLDPAFAAVMEYVVAWFEERGEAVGRDDATGGYLFRGNNLTAHQLVAQANAVRRRLGEPLFALPDSDPPSAPGMGTAAAMVAEAGP